MSEQGAAPAEAVTATIGDAVLGLAVRVASTQTESNDAVFSNLFVACGCFIALATEKGSNAEASAIAMVADLPTVIALARAHLEAKTNAALVMSVIEDLIARQEQQDAGGGKLS